MMNSRAGSLDEPAEDLNIENPSSVDGASFTKLDTNNSGRSTSGQITVDAVHPFFTSYRNIEHYHCRECDQNFETCPKSLKLHFISKRHTPVASCTYCHLPVYEYIHNGNRHYYHRCDEEEIPRTETESNDVDDVDVSDNLINSSTLDGSQNMSQFSNTIHSSVSDVSTDNTSI